MMDAFLQIPILKVFFLSVLVTACQVDDGNMKIDQKTADSWLRLGPGGGGSTFIPTISPHNADHFAVKCDMTGAYFTFDGGASYQMQNFPGGVWSFAYSPLDSTTIYAGAAGLHRTVDRGQNWELIFPPEGSVQSSRYVGDHADFSYVTYPNTIASVLEGAAIEHIAISPDYPSTIFISSKSYLFSSFDEGTSWQRKNLLYNIESIFYDDNDLVIFTAEKQVRLNSEGELIDETPFPEALQSAFSFDYGDVPESDSSIIYALNDLNREDEFGLSVLWRSLDKGHSWQALDAPVLTNEYNQLRPSFSKIAVSRHDASKAYLVCDRWLEVKKDSSYGHWYGILRTADWGKSWEWVLKAGGGSSDYTVRDGREASNIRDSWVKEAFSGEFIRFIDIEAADFDGDFAVVTDWYRVLKTTNGGKDWQERYSASPGNKSYRSRGLDVTTAYGVHNDPFDKNHLAISFTDIGFHHSTDRGQTWKRSVEGVPSAWDNTCYWVVFDPDIEGKIWSGWSSYHDFPRGKMTRNPNWKEEVQGGVCLSIDGGDNWKIQTSGLGDQTPVTSILLDPNSPPGNRTLYATVYNRGVYKSVDDGFNWAQYNQGLGDAGAFWQLSQGDEDLYLITTPTPKHLNNELGREFFWGGLYHSDDGARNWVPVNLPSKVRFPNHLEVDRSNDERLLLSSWGHLVLSDLIGWRFATSTGENTSFDLDGGLWMSEDKGESWKCIFDSSYYVYASAISPYDPQHFLLNTFNHGAWQSFDSGQTWERLAGYDFHWGQRAQFDQYEEGKIYLTTFGGGVWERKSMNRD